MVAYSSNLSTWKAKAGKFEATLDITKQGPVLKIKKKGGGGGGFHTK